MFFEKASVFSACVGLGLCMITGCSNFLNGSNLKESIDEEIARIEEEKKLANTPRVNVRLELERTAYGKLTPQDDYTAKSN